MVDPSQTFRHWLKSKVEHLINNNSTSSRFVVWCDPQGVWRNLLKMAAEDSNFELWADDQHELVLRQRFLSEPPAPRVIWLPVSQDEMGDFKIIALQAAEVIELSLAEALSQFGVDIPLDQRAEIEPLLPAHCAPVDRLSAQSLARQSLPGPGKVFING